MAVAELSPGSATVMESHSLQLSVQMEVRTDMEPRGLTVGALALPSALLLDRLSMMKNLPPRDTVWAALRRLILPDSATLAATLPPDLRPAPLQFLPATATALLSRIPSVLAQALLPLMSTALLQVQSSLTRLPHLRLWLLLTSTAHQLPLFRTPTLLPLLQNLQATLMERP